MYNDIQKTLKELTTTLSKELKGTVRSIVLYGSVARKKATEDSDIDVLVVIPDDMESYRKVSRISYGIDLKNSTVTSAVCFTPEEIETLVNDGSPFIEDVLKEGVVLYDDGTFKEFYKRGAQLMPMQPSRKYVEKCLARADDVLRDAELLFSQNSLYSAAGCAYYAMYHAAQALLYSKGLKPKTHSGLQRMFDEHIIKKGLVGEELGKDFITAFELRQKSDYDVEAEIAKESVEDIVTKARLFISKIKDLLTQKE